MKQSHRLARTWELVNLTTLAGAGLSTLPYLYTSLVETMAYLGFNRFAQRGLGDLESFCKLIRKFF